MKRASLFLLIILIGGIVKVEAQENIKKSLFAISTGYAAFNNGEQGGIFLSNEYIRNINKHLTYGAKYIFAHGEGNIEGLKPQHDIHISTTALDINGFYKPFKSEKHIFLLGVGISIDYTRTSYLSNTDYFIINNKTYTTAGTNGIISLIEGVFSLHYYYNFTQNLFLGFSANARDLDFYQYLIGIDGCIKF